MIPNKSVVWTQQKDKASPAETIDPGSILGRAKPKTLQKGKCEASTVVVDF